MAELRAPPTPLALIIGTAIIAGLSGYMIGIASSLGFLPIPFAPREPKGRGVAYYDDEEESEEEDVDESILDHAPNWANGVEADKRDGLRATALQEKVEKTPWEDNNEECKMVLVVRTDLGMTKGLYPSLTAITLSNYYLEARSRHNAATLRWHASKKSHDKTLRFCAAGKERVRRRLRCRSRARMS
jgi:PTH2 family peptidyl-tRNA hydrolase